jgi:hypothetical protein
MSLAPLQLVHKLTRTRAWQVQRAGPEGAAAVEAALLRLTPQARAALASGS